MPNLNLACFNFSNRMASCGAMLKPAFLVWDQRLLHCAAIFEGSIDFLALLSGGMLRSTASHHISNLISCDDLETFTPSRPSNAQFSSAPEQSNNLNKQNLILFEQNQFFEIYCSCGTLQSKKISVTLILSNKKLNSSLTAQKQQTKMKLKN